MIPVHILVDSLADRGLANAQMGNAREIICRLDPEHFQVSVFHLGEPDERIATRPHTRLIRLPRRRLTARILAEFLLGQHDILFYVKSSPASKWYLRLRKKWKDARISIGSVESQSNLRKEPTIAREAVRLWEQTVLRCDYLFSNSLAVRQSLEREYGLPSEIVPTGVDTKFFTPPFDRPANPRPRVLFSGSLRPYKQPQMLLEAAARFPGADFVLVGEGSMAKELEVRVRRERLQNVVLAGFLDASQLRQQYRRADVFLFPSIWEGSPKVILEAASCGLPVIARNNYRPETVLEGKSGYVVGSDEELFVRLGELLACPDRRREFGAAGRRHSEQYDWELVTRRWEEVFLNLMSQRAGGNAA